MPCPFAESKPLGNNIYQRFLYVLVASIIFLYFRVSLEFRHRCALSEICLDIFQNYNVKFEETRATFYFLVYNILCRDLDSVEDLFRGINYS